MLNLKSFAIAFLLLSLFLISTYSQKKAKIDYSKQIEKSTPKSLPQTPVAEKLKPDAEDGNLKGKVKSLMEEREGFTGVEAGIGKRMSLISDFNEKGNFLRQVYFNYQGRPYSVTVYGYIDGMRVSDSSSIDYDDDVRLAIATPKDNTKPDLRYDLRYEYKYVNGKLAEMQLFNNKGSKSMRYVYNYNENQMEKLVYTEDGKLNQKYLTVFDNKGNEVEWTHFDTLKPKVYGDSKYFIKYESFDKKGNWTKKTMSLAVNENGKEVQKISSIAYWTITYYP